MKGKNKLTYNEAIKRLEEITRKIENGEMDIDTLTEQLKEAKGLVTFCKDMLTKTETDITKILSE